MRTTTLFMTMLALVFISGLTMAATGPLLQITNNTITPSPVYAGTMGYLQITLNNVGDSIAYGTGATYVAGGVSGSVSVGDIGIGSSAQAIIPFSADSSAAGGIQLVSVDIYYTYQSTATSTTGSSGASTQKLSLQVPIQVSQPNPLQVRTVSISPPAISAGESVTLHLTVQNIGGLVNNLVISTPANSSFSLSGGSQQVVGAIDPNASKSIDVTLLSSSSTSIGTYSVPLAFTYYDRLNRPNEVNISVGPLSVVDASSQYRLTLTPGGSVYAGSTVLMHLSLSNTADRTISAVVDLSTVSSNSSVFTPIGSQQVYFDSIAPNSTASADVSIGVSSTAAPGYYNLPLKLTPSVGASALYYSGVSVEDQSSLEISMDQSGASGDILIANTGNSPIRSVYVTVTSRNNQTAPVESFIGTLNVDDYSSVAWDTSYGAAHVVVNFKDSRNTLHTITKDVTANGGSVAGTGAGRSSNFNGTPRQPGLLGALGVRGGAAGGSASSAGGLPLVPIGIGIVVVVVVFFAWRHFKGKKKKDANAA